MTAPLRADRRLGIIQSLVTGPPPRVTLTLGGDEDVTHVVDAAYLDSYAPAVGDVVQVLSNQGAPLVLGRAATGAQSTSTFAQRNTSVTTITTTQVPLLTTSALALDGGTDMEILFGFDSWLSTAVDDRMGLRIQGSLNAGAYSDLARQVPRYIGATASQSEGGGTLYTVHAAPAAGSWTWRVTAVREAGTGTLQVNAATGQLMTLSVKRFR